MLGVTFLKKQDGAQILVKMVDKLPGANGRTHFEFTEHGVARLASIEVVHARWAGAPAVQIKVRTVQRDAAHGMGQALAIVGHTTQPGTIMFPARSLAEATTANRADSIRKFNRGEKEP